MMFEIGDRVRITQVTNFEPTSDAAALNNQLGTVVNPAVEDEDAEGNSTFLVEVTLDVRVDLGGQPAHLASIFVFDPGDLIAVDGETP